MAREKPEVAIIFEVVPLSDEPAMTSKEIANLTGLPVFKVATILNWHMKNKYVVSIPLYLKRLSKPIHTWKRIPGARL